MTGGAKKLCEPTRLSGVRSVMTPVLSASFRTRFCSVRSDCDRRAVNANAGFTRGPRGRRRGVPICDRSGHNFGLRHLHPVLTPVNLATLHRLGDRGTKRSPHHDRPTIWGIRLLAHSLEPLEVYLGCTF